jgi:hypothetical protein
MIDIYKSLTEEEKAAWRQKSDPQIEKLFINFPSEIQTPDGNWMTFSKQRIDLDVNTYLGKVSIYSSYLKEWFVHELSVMESRVWPIDRIDWLYQNYPNYKDKNGSWFLLCQASVSRYDPELQSYESDDTLDDWGSLPQYEMIKKIKDLPFSRGWNLLDQRKEAE